MNNVQFIGRLTQDPVYRELPGSNGGHVTDLRLAVQGMGAGSRDAVGFIDAVSYTMTEKAARTVGKGWLVAVAGRLEHETWERDGVKRSKHRVVTSRVEFLAAPHSADSESHIGETDAPDETDIPF
jgi:single stranded DNA-binding protein